MADTEGFRGTLDVNLIGAVLGLKHGVKALRKRGGGSITLGGSSNAGGWSRGGYAGELGDITLMTPYGICSAALDQLVRISSYYQNENIRVYGLKPGVYSSDMIDGFLEIFKEIDPDATEESFSNFNLFFKGLPGDSKHIGHIVEVCPCPNRHPSAYPHSHRPACNKVKRRRFPHRIASTPPPQPPTNTCTQTHTYDDPNL